MDLDDDELKATKNKFYKYNKDEFDKYHNFVFMDKEKITLDFLKIFIKTENEFCRLKKCDVKDILNIIEKLENEIIHQRQQRKYWRDNFYKQQKEIEELKDEINEMWSHIPRLD